MITLRESEAAPYVLGLTALNHLAVDMIHTQSLFRLNRSAVQAAASDSNDPQFL